ncbi:MAG: TolC family outer membrane protein [Nevskiales bacterium]
MTCIAKQLLSRLPAAALIGLACALPAQAMTLSEALERSLKHDPTVPLSLATFEAERELGAQLTGTLKPDLSLDGNVNRYKNENQSQFFGSFDEEYTGYGAGLLLRQPVYRFDWSARRKQGKALNALADLNLRDRTLQLFTRIAERYFGVLVAQDELRLAQAEAKAIRESLEDTRKRYEVQLVPGTDLKEAQARDDLALARLISARQQLLSAQDALDESTGNGRVALPALPAEAALPPLEPADAESWVAKVRGANPAVLLARENVTVARSQYAAARANRWPALDAVAAYRHDDDSDSRIGSERDNARVGLELSVPIYQGGVTSARQRESEARLKAAEADAARVTAETERQARQVFRQLEAAYAQARALDLAVKSAATAAEATRNGYDAGTRTITDVLNARSALIQAQRDYSRTRYDLLFSWLQLKQLTGELGVADFQTIDQLLRRPENT